MKKILAFMLAVVMVLSLAACGGGGSQTTAPTEKPAEEPKTEEPAAAEEPTAEGPAEEAPTEEEPAWEPTEDVTLIIAYSPGGGSDLLARTFVNEGADNFATTLIPTNIPGGSCALGYTELINAEPDGLTIGNTNTSAVVNGLSEGAPYVYYKELQPLCQIGSAPYVVYVPSSSDIMDLDDLKEAILSRDVISAAAGRGSNTHWEMEYFALKAGGDVTSVIYDGGAPCVAALLGGHADVTVQTPADGAEYVRSGDLRAIAVLYDERLQTEEFKDVPTSAEQGYDWLVNYTFHGYAAPKGVSEDVITYYENAFKACLETDVVREAIENYGFTVAFEDSEGFGEIWNNYADYITEVKTQLGDRLDE